MDHEEYLKRVKSYIKTPTKEMEELLAEFVKVCTYISGQYDQDESFVNLLKHIEELEKGQKETNRVFYMALPPSVFIPVSQHLKKICYPKNGIARVIVSSISSFVMAIQLLTNDLIGRKAVRKGPWQLPRTSEGSGTGLGRR
jgi:glucose-6-phosphate 1-dehydrogenase